MSNLWPGFRQGFCREFLSSPVRSLLVLQNELKRIISFVGLAERWDTPAGVFCIESPAAVYEFAVTQEARILHGDFLLN